MASPFMDVVVEVQRCNSLPMISLQGELEFEPR